MALSKQHESTDTELRRPLTRILAERASAAPKALGCRVKDLSQAQLEMLRARASGQTRKQIAYTLGVSVKTIEYHFSRIYRSLGLSDDIELTHYAIRNGLIEVKAFGQ